MKLTNRRFFYLQLAAHTGLVYLLFVGEVYQILITLGIAGFILLFSSTIMYHRYLSHRSWNAPKWFEIFSTCIGIFSFTGSSIVRTLSHRYHHAFSDTEKDPHSPRYNSIFYTYFPMLRENNYNPMLVKDLLGNKFHRNIHEYYLAIIVSTIAVSCMIIGPLWTVILLVAPGAVCWTNISLCNIACHWGKKDALIKQNTILAWMTFGEGYHRHHHESPTDPNFGQNKIDPGYIAIKLILFLDNLNKPSTRI